MTSFDIPFFFFCMNNFFKSRNAKYLNNKSLEPTVAKLKELIMKATSSNSRVSVSKSNIIEEIKKIVKESNINIKHLCELLMIRMEENDSQVRLWTLEIVNDIFNRSKYFRVLLLTNFKEFLELCVGYKQPLPPPTTSATLLREKCIELVENWNKQYDYNQLVVGLHHLKNNSPKLLSVQQFKDKQNLENRRKFQQILEQTYRKMVNEFEESVVDIELNLKEMVKNKLEKMATKMLSFVFIFFFVAKHHPFVASGLEQSQTFLQQQFEKRERLK